METSVTKFVLRISPYSLPFLYTLIGALFKDDIKILLSDFCETGKFICVLEKISIVICAIIIVTLFIFAISFFFDLFIAIYKNITNWYSAFRYPKITHRFELPNENDLRLYISNPKSARKVYVNCLYKRLRTMAEGDYLLAHRNELQLVQDKGRHPIFSGVLAPNDTREIKIGEP